MRVMYVDQTGQLGGGELSLLDVVAHSSHQGEVTLFADGPFREELESIGMRVHLLALGRAADVHRSGGLLSVLAAIPDYAALRRRLIDLSADFDVLYANSQKAFLLAALALRRDQRLIWHLRDMLTDEHFSQILRNVAVFAGNHKASVVIGNSQATIKSFECSGGRSDKAIVVYNGISPRPFDAVGDNQIEGLRRGLGLQGRVLVGVFGRLAPWKGQHVLLEAVAKMPDVHVLIVGDALFGEQDYAAALRSRSQVDDLKGRVLMLGFRRDIPALMRLANIIVHTSTAPEPFGRVIVEGMLARRPVIATRAGGAVEIVDSGENGLLVSPGHSEELSKCISQLISNPALADKIAAAGRKRAVEHFSVDAMVNSIDQIIAGSHSSLKDRRSEEVRVLG